MLVEHSPSEVLLTSLKLEHLVLTQINAVHPSLLRNDQSGHLGKGIVESNSNCKSMLSATLRK